MKRNSRQSILAFVMVSILMISAIGFLSNNTIAAEGADNTEATLADDGLTPFERYGAIRVEGPKLVSESGEVTQLYGLSTLGIAWYPEYVNYETFETLRDEWKVNCVRLSMYTVGAGGYCSGGNREELKELIENGVRYATDLGMYIIVDWHILSDGDPNTYKQDAMEFFDEMSAKWKDHDNVLYEICNEPNSGTTWEDIKQYANAVVPAIRANDPNAIVLVGTPTWCQEIDKPVADPLEFDNVMYTLHFYAATHGDWLRNLFKRSAKAGLPIFISEFGICESTGDGFKDYVETELWLKLIEKYDTSYIMWSLANADATSCIVKPECEKLSHWEDDDLTDTGRWVRYWFQTKGK